MSISFSCEHCGKSFTVDDQLAGKKGRCKQCGGSMQIPGQARTADPVLSTSSPSRRVPRPVLDTSPAEDVYGFDEAPLPPRIKRGSSDEGRNDTKPVSPIKKKKKPYGFFAGLGGKSKSSSSGGSPSIDLSPRLIRVALGLIVMFVVLPIYYGTVGGLKPRAQIEEYYRRQIIMVHELADLLQTVHDSEGAASASEKVNAKFRELSRYTKANMNLKGKRSDINALSQQYKVQQDQASQRLKDEFNRLGDIPGAMEALDVEAALQETAAVEAEIQRLKAQNQNNGIQ